MSTTNDATPPVIFPARAFAFVAPFRAEHDIRYYLNGFAVEPHPEGGVIVAATNGHQLAVAYCKNGRADRHRIFTCTKALVSAAKKPRAAFVGLKHNRLTVIESPAGTDLDEWNDADGIETFIQSGNPDITGNFPDIAKVIPRVVDGLEHGLRSVVAARYIEAIGRGAKFVGGRHFSGCQHWTRRGGSGVVITRFPKEPNFLVLTMPMREEGISGGPLPDFMAALHSESDERQRKEAAKAAEKAAANEKQAREAA